MARLSGFCGFGLLWWVVTTWRAVPPVLLADPASVLAKSLELLTRGELVTDARVTLARTVVGFILGSLAGATSGFIIGRIPEVKCALEGVIDFLRSIPVVVLFPLFILALGMTDESKMFAIGWTAFPIMVVNTMYGVSTLNATRQDWCVVAKITGLRKFFLVDFWELLPSVCAGLRTAFAAALITSVVSEMIYGSAYGLGRLIFDAGEIYDTPRLYVGILTVGAIGYVVNAMFAWGESRLRRWI